MPPNWNVIRESKRDTSKVHTIEEIESGHYKLDDVEIKYVYQLDNEGWCIYDKNIGDNQQKLIDSFENTLLTAMKLKTKDKAVLSPPAGL